MTPTPLQVERLLANPPWDAPRKPNQLSVLPLLPLLPGHLLESRLPRKISRMRDEINVMTHKSPFHRFLDLLSGDLGALIIGNGLNILQKQKTRYHEQPNKSTRDAYHVLLLRVLILRMAVSFSYEYPIVTYLRGGFCVRDLRHCGCESLCAPTETQGTKAR